MTYGTEAVFLRIYPLVITTWKEAVMTEMDIMDIRAESAFSKLLAGGYLITLEPGGEDGIRLYGAANGADTANLSRDELLVLHQARWPYSSADIIRKASAKFRNSNQVRRPARRFFGGEG